MGSACLVHLPSTVGVDLPLRWIALVAGYFVMYVPNSSCHTAVKNKQQTALCCDAMKIMVELFVQIFWRLWFCATHLTLPLEVELREPGRKIRVQYRSVAIHHCTEPYSGVAYKINNTVVTHLVLVCKQNDIPGCHLQKGQADERWPCEWRQHGRWQQLHLSSEESGHTQRW